MMTATRVLTGCACCVGREVDEEPQCVSSGVAMAGVRYVAVSCNIPRTQVPSSSSREPGYKASCEEVGLTYTACLGSGGTWFQIWISRNSSTCRDHTVPGDCLRGEQTRSTCTSNDPVHLPRA